MVGSYEESQPLIRLANSAATLRSRGAFECASVRCANKIGSSLD